MRRRFETQLIEQNDIFVQFKGGGKAKYTLEMERTIDGAHRTKIFYCDPQTSWQKAHIKLKRTTSKDLSASEVAAAEWLRKNKLSSRL